MRTWWSAPSTGRGTRRGAGTSEDAEAFFNGTMSRFLVHATALTQSQIASVIS
jgi:hypothetical protein